MATRIELGSHSAEYLFGIHQAAPDYDAFLLDIWGVLHDSANPYPGVIDCLKELKKAGKTLYLLSNAARRAYVLEKELIAFGILPTLYDRIISSGELTWSAFAAGDEQLARLGGNYFLLGSEKYGLTDGLPLSQAAAVAEADFLLNIGVIGNPSTTEAEEPYLREAAQRKLPMVCANPDVQVVRDGVMGIAAGAVASRYEELGGSVIYFGKPHRAVYDHCFELLKGVAREKIAAVGDALKTDIAGGAASGIDTIMVGTGIHRAEIAALPEDSRPLAAACRQQEQYPTMIVPAFCWEIPCSES